MLALSLTAASTTAAAQATIGGAWREDLAAFAGRVVDAGLTPGMAVAVTVGDWVVWADGFGLADAATGRRVTGDTPFYIASSTKSLTATAAALAAHAGRLDFSAPLVRYLPEARFHPDVPRERIRVHDAAALTHGLSGGGPVVLRTAFTGQFTRDELLDLLRFHEPTGNYGTFSYDNLGYNLLGLVLEAVYEESWKDVVQRLVLDPVGMTSTTAYLSRIPPDHIALPHDATPDGWVRMVLAKDDRNLHAAGGHFATARDLARYVAAHLTGGVVEGERVLPVEPLLLTHRQQAAQDRTFGPYHRHGWAYGWDLGTYRGDTLIHRFGGFSGYRSHLSFMPQHGLGVVVLVNGDGPASDAADLVATYAYDRVRNVDGAEAGHARALDSLVTRLAQYRRAVADHLAERRARLAPLRHPLADFAGTYESPILGRMEWRVIAGGLELGMGVVRSRAEVYDAAKDQLRVEIGSGQVATFAFPESGGPATAVRVGGVEFRRVAPGT
jgi:CubicO group peptidase (beta-lactamase class C family)